MAKCPYCKNEVEGFRRITTENLVETQSGWKLVFGDKTIEVRCRYCKSELGEDDFSELGIPIRLVEEE